MGDRALGLDQIDDGFGEKPAVGVGTTVVVRFPPQRSGPPPERESDAIAA